MALSLSSVYQVSFMYFILVWNMILYIMAFYYFNAKDWAELNFASVQWKSNEIKK